jgi:hypothetical protein
VQTQDNIDIMSDLESQLAALRAVYAEMVQALAILDKYQEHLIAAQLSLAVEALSIRLLEMSTKPTD